MRERNIMDNNLNFLSVGGLLKFSTFVGALILDALKHIMQMDNVNL